MEIEEIRELIKRTKHSKSKREKSKTQRKLLNNQESLEKLVKDYYTHNINSKVNYRDFDEIIKYLKNEIVLSYIALYDPLTFHRRNAIINPNLQDEEILTKIALKGTGSYREINRAEKESYYNISLAIEKINNQSLLEKIVNNSDDDEVIIKALEKISSEKLLRKYAFRPYSYDIRMVAVSRINDQKILEDVLNSFNFETVKSAAIKKMTNQELLKKIATNKEFLKDRLKIKNYCIPAIETINDEDTLIYLAKSGKSSELRETAIENPNLVNEKVLIDFAKYDDSDKVRLAAVKKISKQDVLIDIALHSHDYDILVEAANKINNKNALREIQNNCTDEWYSRRLSTIINDRIKEINQLSRYRQSNLLNDK